MKNIIRHILVITCICSINILFGQKKESSNQFKYRFGFKIAPNIGWISSDDKSLKSNGAPFGFSYGLTFDMKMNKSFLLTSGFDITSINHKSVISRNIFFEKAGEKDTANHQITYTSNPTNYSNRLRYVEIPILFSGRTKEIGYYTYFFQAGFTPSFLVKQKATITTSNSSIKLDNPVLLDSENKEEYVTRQDDIAKIRVGFVLGAGAEYNLQGTTSLIGSIRYNNGIFNIMHDPNREFNPVKNHYISLNVGIVF